MGNLLHTVDRNETNSVILAAEADKAAQAHNTRRNNRTSAGSSNRGIAFLVTKQKHDGPTAAATISDLPVELLATIVSQLPIRQWKQLELMNRKFRAAVLMAWYELELVDFLSIFGYDFGLIYKFEREALREREQLRNFLETLVVRSPRIKTLKPRSCLSNLMMSIVIQHIHRFEHLEALSLLRSGDSVRRLGLLSRTTVAIFRRLSLLQSSSCNDEELTEILSTALSRMPLQELVYQSCLNADEEKFLLTMNVDQLRSLNLACSVIDFNILNQLLPRCERLTHLDLTLTQPHMVALSTTNLFSWLKTAKNLISLKLNCFVFNDHPVRGPIWRAALQQSLFELGSFQALTELEMMDSHFCTDAMINVIAVRLANCLKILRLDISHCTEATLLNLVSSMVNLERLTFWSYENGLRHGSICKNVTDNVVYAIVANLSKLIALDLCRPSASADTLTNLIQLEKLQELVVVEMFNDDTLITVASALGHQLTTLEMPISSRVSDKGVVAALQHLDKLRYLVLSGTEISDRSLMALSQSCLALRRLGLVGCRNITSKGVQAIIGSCQNLEELYLRGSSVDVDKLRKCDWIWKKFKQISLLDRELASIYDRSSECFHCSNSLQYWHWTYVCFVCLRRMR